MIAAARDCASVTSGRTPAISRWLSTPRPVADPRVRLICVPYAGGHASMFHAYGNDLPTDVEVCAVQLPGRGARFGEPAFTSMEPLVDSLAEAVLPLMDRPVAIFGHSMGALIAFELARALHAACGQAPLHLFVSGQAAPHLPRRRPPVHDQPASAFVAEIRRLGGTPAEALEHPELLEIVLPTLRADFTVCETYRFRRTVPLACPITAFGGLQDSEASPVELADWRRHTEAEFRLQMFAGNHFYVVSERPRVVRAIAEAVSHD